MRIKFHPRIKLVIALVGMYIKTVNIIMCNMLKNVNETWKMVSIKIEDIKQTQIKILDKKTIYLK